jgi:antitoxin HigA-1
MEIAMLYKRKPTHPGEILREDIIKPLNLTVTEAAEMLGVTRKTLSALLNCRSAMSPSMAIRVGKATGTSPASWLFMQAKLDLWYAESQKLAVKSFKMKPIS